MYCDFFKLVILIESFCVFEVFVSLGHLTWVSKAQQPQEQHHPLLFSRVQTMPGIFKTLWFVLS